MILLFDIGMAAAIIGPCPRVQVKLKLNVAPGSFYAEEFLLQHGLWQHNRSAIKYITPFSGEEASIITLHAPMKEVFKLQRLYPNGKSHPYTHKGQLTKIELQSINFLGKPYGQTTRKNEMDGFYLVRALL